MNEQAETPPLKKSKVQNSEEPVKIVRVFVAAIGANLSNVSVGISVGWTSPVLPKLMTPNSTDTPLSHMIDRNEEAWITSTIAVGAAIAPFLAALLADKIGRKSTILFSAVFFVMAFVTMLFATETWIMLVGRFLMGFGSGCVMSVVPMYVGEIATDKVRGAVGSLMSLFICVGIFAVLSIGPFVSYYVQQYFCIAVPIFCLVVLALMPESPYFSIAKGRRATALKALKFLRGQSEGTVEKELMQIETMVQSSMAQKGRYLDLIKIYANRRALLICIGLITFQQASGIDAVLFNAESILVNAQTGLDGAIAAIIIAAVQLVMAGLTPLISDRFGRKVILLTSIFFMGVGLALMGTFLFIEQRLGYGKEIKWLPIPALLLYTIMFTIGYGPVPWTILGEMFSPNIKSKAASLVTSESWVVGFLVAFSYAELENFGIYYAFWIFTLICVAAFVFTWYVVMETRGLSLQEIQNRLNSK